MPLITHETWGVAFDALRANKVKAALTMLGVIIGSACIVLVVTIALIGMLEIELLHQKIDALRETEVLALTQAVTNLTELLKREQAHAHRGE